MNLEETKINEIANKAVELIINNLRQLNQESISNVDMTKIYSTIIVKVILHFDLQKPNQERTSVDDLVKFVAAILVHSTHMYEHYLNTLKGAH
jgi:hypothetical protein